MNDIGRIISEGLARQARIYNGRVLSLIGLLVFIVCPRLYSGPVVKWWISSEDMRNKLSPQTDAIFAPVRQLSKSAIAVDDKTTYQSIIGLGSSLEHSTCYNISLLPPAGQKKVLESIVDKNKGIGMNLMRICFGTADFTSSPWYSYDDPPDKKTDPQLKYFSIEKDREYVLPILKLAQQINPELKFFASSWSLQERKIVNSCRLALAFERLPEQNHCQGRRRRRATLEELVGWNTPRNLL